eukprot:8627769-Lingulodinium_polyedra.AAC.1
MDVGWPGCGRAERGEEGAGSRLACACACPTGFPATVLRPAGARHFFRVLHVHNARTHGHRRAVESGRWRRQLAISRAARHLLHEP